MSEEVVRTRRAVQLAASASPSSTTRSSPPAPSATAPPSSSAPTPRHGTLARASLGPRPSPRLVVVVVVALHEQRSTRSTRTASLPAEPVHPDHQTLAHDPHPQALAQRRRRPAHRGEGSSTRRRWTRLGLLAPLRRRPRGHAARRVAHLARLDPRRRRRALLEDREALERRVRPTLRRPLPLSRALSPDPLSLYAPRFDEVHFGGCVSLSLWVDARGPGR